MMKRLLLMLCVMSSQLLSAKTVGPLIKTQWSQEEPFNMLCPEIDGQHCLTSCGATAMAQICYYHRWPEHGMGEGHWHIADGELHYVDLTPDYYEYDKMLLTYNANSSEDAKMAVALLMRDVAYLGAVFSLVESFSPTPGELTRTMGYDMGIMHLNDGYFSQEDLRAIIRSELDAGRPVILSGSNGSMGHSFICDGYNDNNEYHFNYGWAGDSDGWSTLEGCLFPISMQIDFNIKKDAGGEPGFTLSSNKDFKWLGGNKLYGNYNFETYSPYELMPQIALAVENTETHEVQYFYHYDREPSNTNDVELVWDLDADLADGSYVLYPVGHGKERNKEWQKAYFRDLCQKEVTLTVKDGVKTFANSSLNDPVRDGVVEVDNYCYELDEEAGTASLTYRNDKFASYASDVVVPETITVGEKTYKVTAIGKEAFRECVFLENVTIGKNVQRIGFAAFDRVVANKVSFAEGSQLKTIEESGFYLSNIKEIVLPEGLEDIGIAAFANSNLGSITIPSTVNTWGSFCFSTFGLVSVHLNITTPPFLDEMSGYFRKNPDDVDFVKYDDGVANVYGIESAVLYVPAGTKAAYAQADVWKDFGFILDPDDDDSFVDNIIRDVIEIDGFKYQFNGVKGIARVVRINKEMEDVIVRNTITMGEKELAVTAIGNRFIDGINYNRVVISANVETLDMESIHNSEIGSLEFEEGSHLKTILEQGFNEITLKSPLVLPEGLENFGPITCTDVADLTIPASVTSMGSYNNFADMKHLRVSWTEPLKVDNLLNNDFAAAWITLHVPVGTKELYDDAEGWKLFGKIVEGNDIKGDVDGNGVVDDEDRALFVEIIMGEVQPDEATLKRADVNEDTYVNAADLVTIISIITNDDN